MDRSYEDELKFIVRNNKFNWQIKKGFVPNMKVSIVNCQCCQHSDCIQVRDLKLIIVPLNDLNMIGSVIVSFHSSYYY